MEETASSQVSLINIKSMFSLFMQSATFPSLPCRPLTFTAPTPDVPGAAAGGAELGFEPGFDSELGFEPGFDSELGFEPGFDSELGLVVPDTFRRCPRRPSARWSPWT